MSRWGLSTLKVAGGSARAALGSRSESTRVSFQYTQGRIVSIDDAVGDGWQKERGAKEDPSRDKDDHNRTPGVPWSQLANTTEYQQFLHSETSQLNTSSMYGRRAYSLVQGPTSAPDKFSSQFVVMLRFILSLPDASILPFGQCSLRHLRILYYSVKSSKQLHLLSPADFSLFICFFGALSMSTQQKPYSGPFGHALVKSMTEQSYRSCWALVKEVAENKAALGMPLTHSDRYWLMRVHLAALGKVTGQNARQKDSEAFLWARAHYREISRVVPDPTVHLAYLNALLSIDVPEVMSEAVSALCDFLGRHDYVTAELRDTMWRVVLERGAQLSHAQKEAILNAVGQRARSRLPIIPSADVHDRHKELRASELVLSIYSALFDMSSMRETRLQQELLHWSRAMARQVLVSDFDTMDTRWSALSLFGLVASGSTTLGSSIFQSAPARNTASADWRTICALTSLEQLFQKSPSSLQPFSDDIAQRVSRILEYLWSDWSRMQPDNQRPLVVVRAICASFLHLAGRLKSKLVRVTCQEYCVRKGLWTVDSDDPSTIFGLRSLAEAHLFCAVACEVRVAHTLEVIAARIGNRSLTSAVVSSCIVRYAVFDADAADDLWAVAMRADVSILTDVLVQLAANMAKQDLGDRALGILTDHTTDFNPDQQWTILREMISVLLDQGARVQPQSFVRGLCDVLQTLTANDRPPDGMRSCLHHLLFTLVRAEFVQEANTIMLAIFRANTSYFDFTFHWRFIKGLLERRQFRVAHECYKLVVDTCGGNDVKLRGLMLRYCARAGAGSLARAILESSPEVPSPDMRMAIRSGFTRIPSRRSTLKICRLFPSSKAQDRPSALYAAQLLSASGRMDAARSLYAKMHEQPPRVRTAMGNAILHSSMHNRSRRNARQMRKVLQMLDQLKKDYAFVPDRVTLNIVLKAFLRWNTAVDSDKLRALFDRLIVNGYPSGSGVPGEAPFGTSPRATAEPGIEIPKVTSQLSHARHVRPLYKMFVKAFHLRGDRDAAVTVIGIMKVEREIAEQEQRDSERGIKRYQAEGGDGQIDG